MDVDAVYSDAMKAIQANQHDRARDLLMRVVKANPRHEEAWLWLAGVMNGLDESIDCLNQVLKLNPNNTKAKEWLAFAKEEKAKESPAKVNDTDVSTLAVNRLGDYLLQNKFITREQLDEALRAQNEAKKRGNREQLGKFLIVQGAITQARLDLALRQQQKDFNSLFRD